MANRSPFAIDGWEVDSISGELRRPGETRRLRPKAMAVLCCLVDADGELVERDDIIQQVWGRELISDEPLTTCIAELRRTLEDKASNPKYIQTVPKRGYRFVGNVSEAGPDQDDDGDGSEAGQAPAPKPSRNLLAQPSVWVGMVVVAVLVFVWMTDSRDVDQPPAQSVPQPVAVEAREAPTIAVLPFVNMSPDPENDYFGDGLAEEILNSLTKIDGLRVRSRTSSFALKDQNLDAAMIAERLKVSHILEGSIRRDGDALRVSAQLIDVQADTPVWSEVFDKNTSNIFDLQGEVAGRVTDALEIALNSEQQLELSDAGTRNIRAYELYLQGRQLLARRTSVSISAALERFSLARELDPNYAQAYLGIADANLLLPQYNDHPNARYIQKSLEAVRKALALNPDFGEAYATLGSVYEEMHDFAAAEEAFELALERAPRYPTTYHWYGFMLYRTAQQEAADRMLRLAIEQDPLSHLLSYGMSANLVAMRRFDAAERRYFDIIDADPEFSWAYEGLGELNWNGRGNLEEAARWYEQAIRYDPDSSYFRALLSAIHLDRGDPAAARTVLEQARGDQAESYMIQIHWALLALFEGVSKAASDIVVPLLDTDPQNYLALIVSRNQDILSGNTEAAIARYESVHPEFLEDSPTLHIDNFQSAVDFAYLLIEAGEIDRATRLLDSAWAIAESYPRHGLPYRLSDVKILTLRGQTDKALDALADALDSGWRPYWWLYLNWDAALEPLRSDERFEGIAAGFAGSS